MKALIILSLLLLKACGAEGSSFKIGETKRADVIAEKGEGPFEEKLRAV